jgi:hypothetical protein
MTLNQFISETLTQIAEGVNQAKPKYKELGGVINPQGFEQIEGGIPYAKARPMHGVASLLCNIQFEVTLAADTSTDGKTGIGVFWGDIGIGVKNSESNKETTLNKVSFNVPVQLP